MAGGASSSTTSSSFSASDFTHDAFLSFRGEDTRYGFTGNLYSALKNRGFDTFIDDVGLPKGNEIRPSLLNAIERSRTAIVVLSKDYASSSFCLDELVKIMESVYGQGRLVIPIFYLVAPTDVRHLTGTYETALNVHSNQNMERLRRWREALKQVADLSGYHFEHGRYYEHRFIANIVDEVSRGIRPRLLPVADHPVGLDFPVNEVIKLLDLGSDDIRMVGIHGIGGVGKTTLAKAVYNKIAGSVEHLSFRLCFVGDVRDNSERGRLSHLQKIVLFQLYGEEIKFTSVDDGASELKKKLQGKKILLVLDDIDQEVQLKALAGESNWFGRGSRVIITTRDKNLLSRYENKITYELEALNEEDALKLLSLKAFKTNQVDSSYVDVLNEVATYASGLPLALEVIGSSLVGKSVQQWKSALCQYKRIPKKEIQSILMVSFNALEELEQKIFLDIACCLRGYELNKVKEILCAHHEFDDSLDYALGVLEAKSLIKTHADWKGVILHDLVQDMGREIVRLESPEIPRERSRLWLLKDIVQVFERNEGSSKIQLINLECDCNGDVIEWDDLALKEMNTLRTLLIKDGRFSQGLKYLPSHLRVLIWDMHPSQEYLSFDFHSKLVILELSRNCFDSIRVAQLLEKNLENLRVLRFDGCKHITRIPNLSCAPKLEELSFEDCNSLTEIDMSVGRLDKLKTLNATACKQLRSLPPLMLPSLENLELNLCSSLESFPEILGKMERMTRIWLEVVPIKKFPYSIRNLTGLQILGLRGGGIVELPSSITLLKQVETLKFQGCEGLLLLNEDEGEEQVSSMSDEGEEQGSSMSDEGEEQVSSMSDEGEEQGSSMSSSKTTELHINGCNISEEFFQIAIPMFPHLEFLHLQRENIKILPKWIEEFQFLRKLHLIDCKKLEEIREIPPNIEELLVFRNTSLSLLTRKCIEKCQFLRRLHLFHCKKLEEIQGIPPNIEELFVIGCTSWSPLKGEMLLDKKLHEEGQDRVFILPWNGLPMWFEHRRREPSITFWFRNKFPAISFVFLFPGVHTDRLFFICKLTINGAKSFDLGKFPVYSLETTQDGLVFIFNKTQTTFRDKVDEVLSENEWNHAVFSVYERREQLRRLIEVGVHIIKEKSCMDDVRFTDPLLQKECGCPLRDKGDCQIHAQLVVQQQQQTNSAPFVQGLQEEQNKLEDCESVDKVCNINAREDKGKNPLLELLSTTKEETEKYQPTSNDETMALDPMEVKYQLTSGSNNKSTRSNETGLEELPRAKRQFCLCTLFSSLVSLCASSSSLDSP